MCEDRLSYAVTKEDEGKSLEAILRKKLDLSGGMIKTLKYNEGLWINEHPGRTVDILSEGDTVTVLLNATDKRPEASPENIPLDILYEDKALIAVNKPAGTVVHTTCLHQSGTLSNALAWHMKEAGISGSIHPVSRLDKDTCGVILFARNGFVQEQLKKQAQAGIFQKIYYGLCSPLPAEEKGLITRPIKRAPESIMLRQAAEDGAPAVTEYRLIKKSNDMALIEFILHTGRTHQIRVHSSFSGFPLVGDNLYGGRKIREISTPGQALIAKRIVGIHPVTSAPFCIEAAWPAWWPKEFLI